MATLRELKSRIGSVASSEKITGAMKMISSAKMHKAEQALRRLVPYRTQVQTILGNLLTADTEFTSPLLEVRPVHAAAIVAFGSDDGLCGAYNVNLYKQLRQHIDELRVSYGPTVDMTVIAVGKKMLKAASRLEGVTVESRPGVDTRTVAAGVKEFTDALLQEFVSGKFDSVELLYMNYRSVSRQSPRFFTLLPVSEHAIVGDDSRPSCTPYIFEPSAQKIFTTMLPMFLLAVMADAFIENRASEQAARVMAMQSANDNAKKLLDQLQLEYNKLRQQSITTELLDILGGQIR